jgi:hypothetical protein
MRERLTKQDQDNQLKETIMKKIAISLIAFAALSTASFASERSDDDSGVPGNGYVTQVNANSTSSNALVVTEKNAGAVSAFERLNQIAAQNSEGGH